MDKIRREKYRISYIIALLLGLWTLVPAKASKPCALGYYAHCSWTPWSTLICLVIAGVLYGMGKRRRLMNYEGLIDEKLCRKTLNQTIVEGPDSFFHAYTRTRTRTTPRRN